MKRILLLMIPFIAFSCTNSDSKSANKSQDKKEYTEASRIESPAGGAYAEEGEMNSEMLNSANTKVTQTNKDYKREDGLQKEDDLIKLEVPEEMIDAKIIKTANMRFQVLDVEQSTRDIQKILKTKGAYISDMNQSKNQNHFYSEISIRVPNLYFDDVLNQLTLSGEKVDYKRISSQDVTEEFVDIQTRLKTKKEVKQRYEEILRNKAKTVSEVLETEEKLRGIQEEIEAQEGRLRYLANQTDMSTIYLTIYEEGVDMDEVMKEKEFKERATSGFADGWAGVLNVIVALTYMWPGILITLFILIWKRKFFIRMKNTIKKTFSSSKPEVN